MLLKSLEIQGFKSFPDRTKITVLDGITAVVGPNGSGKSNISDALRWVLGETSVKQLRGGSKMEDVIFGGTQNRSAMGFASVTVLLDNSDKRLDMDAVEVAIGRKSYRSGESEYTINAKQVRLKDIYELFLDTGLGKDGYSMIGQGRIAEIVSAKSGERREIFEEASGIAKYRYRKNEAEKRLSATSENLIRLTDILGELTDRVGPLQKEAEKAKRYLILANERKQCEVTLFLDTVKKTTEQVREAAKKLEIANREYSKNKNEIDALEKSIDLARERASASVLKTEQKNAEIRVWDETGSGFENRIAVLQNDNIHNAGRRDVLKTEQAENEQRGEGEGQRLTDAEQRLGELTQKHKTAGEVVVRLIKEIEQLAQEALKTGRQKEGIELQITAGEARLSDFRVKLAAVGADEITLGEQLCEVQNETEQLEEDVKSAKQDAKKAQQHLEDLEIRITSLSNISEGLRLKAEVKRSACKKSEDEEELQSRKAEAAKNRLSLLLDLEKNMEGFSGSVKEVLAAGKTGRISGILGVVSSIIGVKSGYETAVETALGVAATHIIVEKEQVAKSAIRMLKEEKLGRATFLPLDTVKPSPEIKDRLPQGAVSAENLVFADKKYEDIISSLLGRILVADDLNAAGEIAKKLDYRYRVVTLDGQMVNAGGSFTGGSNVRGSGAFTRKSEIESLTIRCKEFDKQRKEQAFAILKEQAEVAKIAADLDANDAEIRVCKEEAIKAGVERDGINTLSLATQKALQVQTEKVSVIRERLQQQKQQKKQIEEETENTKTEIVKLRQSYNDFCGQSDEPDSNRNSRQEKLNEAKLMEMSLQKDKEQAVNTLNMLNAQASEEEQRRQGWQKQIDSLSLQIAQNETEIVELTQKKLAAKKKTAELIMDIEKISAQRLQDETDITRQNSSLKALYDSREEFSKEKTRLQEREYALQTEYEGAITKLWEEYELSLTTAEEFVIEYESFAALKRRVSELRNEIKSLGNINVAAIDEYTVVFERYTFMKKQVEDIQKARDGLFGLINELSGEMREIFTRNFTEINQNFVRIFIQLFGGGTAELTLSGDGDVLEKGIEISVSPPGKLIKNLQSLSGGEQTLVAIAIYFAILAVNPAPFCVLDEIDAALDDINVVRFAGYLRKITQHTQFLVITHRRGTMEEADVLYGVTMQEDGVSKLLRLDIASKDVQLSGGEL